MENIIFRNFSKWNWLKTVSNLLKNMFLSKIVLLLPLQQLDNFLLYHMYLSRTSSCGILSQILVKRVLNLAKVMCSVQQNLAKVYSHKQNNLLGWDPVKIQASHLVKKKSGKLFSNLFFGLVCLFSLFKFLTCSNRWFSKTWSM
jgi:hypothetical protein